MDDYSLFAAADGYSVCGMACVVPGAAGLDMETAVGGYDGGSGDAAVCQRGTLPGPMAYAAGGGGLRGGHIEHHGAAISVYDVPAAGPGQTGEAGATQRAV